jgi:hypothetical protein
MSNQDQELTAEQYKVNVLKQRFAQRVTELEEEIATLLTQLAIEQQQRQEVERAYESTIQASNGATPGTD